TSRRRARFAACLRTLARAASRLSVPPAAGRPPIPLQSNTEHVSDVVGVDEVETLALLLGDLLHVALVAVGDDHLLDARSLGGERLLLQAADRQDLPRQCDLAGHRHVVAYRAIADQRGERGGHRYSRGRAILGYRA